MSERESRKSSDDHEDDPDDNDDDLVLRSEDRDTDMALDAPVSSFLSESRLKQTGCTTHYQTRFTSEDIFFYSSSFVI